MVAVAYITSFSSPIGHVRIDASDRGITGIGFTESPAEASFERPTFLQECEKQLMEYFEGTRKAFDSLPLVFRATEFQEKVWEAAMKIPFGATVGYGRLAKETGNAQAARAVGTALGRNPLMIIVPCHRIIASDGTDGGYAGGLWRKAWLLKHEQK